MKLFAVHVCGINCYSVYPGMFVSPIEKWGMNDRAWMLGFDTRLPQTLDELMLHINWFCFFLQRVYRTSVRAAHSCVANWRDWSLIFQWWYVRPTSDRIHPLTACLRLKSWLGGPWVVSSRCCCQVGERTRRGGGYLSKIIPGTVTVVHPLINICGTKSDHRHPHSEWVCVWVVLYATVVSLVMKLWMRKAVYVLGGLCFGLCPV